jgi:hypothetical protein
LASVYAPVNVHNEPYTRAPSFFQIKEGEKVSVVGHAIVPRIEPPRQPLIPPKPKTPPPERKRDANYPPMPAAPPLPPNWQELSKSPPVVLQQIAEAKAENAPPNDDWSLVRNAQGESGWVLTRMLFMAIPDEVAQDSEGRRITSYFSLADVDDDGQKKHDWLWTTISGMHPYDFDSFRVFVWSLRHHRYETAYIQRNVVGYFPVRLHPVQLSSSGRGQPSTTTYPGFSVCLENDDGSRAERNFAFIVNFVRFAGDQPCAAPVNLLASGQPAAVTPTATASLSLSGRLRALVKKWFSH